MGPKKSKRTAPAEHIDQMPFNDGDGDQHVSETKSHQPTPAVGDSEMEVSKKRTMSSSVSVSVADALNEEEEGDLAEWFGERPMYWDKVRKDFKNAELKDRILEDKARSYTGKDLTGKQLKTWFTTQRSNYGRWRYINNQKSGSGKAQITHRNKWVLAHFSWLEGHVAVRTQTSQLGAIGGPPTCEEGEQSDGDIQLPVLSQPSQRSAGNSKPAKPTKSRREQVDEGLLQLVRCQVQRAEAAATPTPSPARADTIGAFMAWVECESRLLSEQQWSAFQRRTMQLLMEAKYTNPSSASRPEPSHASAPTYSARTATSTPQTLYGNQNTLQPILFHNQLPGYQRQLQPQPAVQQLGEFGSALTRQYPFTSVAQPLSMPTVDMSGIIPSTLQTNPAPIGIGGVSGLSEYLADSRILLNPDTFDADKNQ